MNATPVVLCGSNYGACYVPSLQELTDSFELVGILAAGSERSARLAARRHVPLLTSAAEVPEGARAAIVALPPPTAGMVTAQLLRRGVHVLMEHPVRADLLREPRQEALSAKVIHAVNCHFGELGPARAFVGECRRRCASSPPTYASVVTAPRSAYATFDLLGRALGSLAGSALEREVAPSATPEHPFTSFRGVIADVPVRVQCSHDVGAVDDGSDSPVPQRIEIGFPDGSLLLHSYAGPVIWLEKFRMQLRNTTIPLWQPHAPEITTFSGLMDERVQANNRALREFREQIDTGNQPDHQTTEWLTAVAELATATRTRQTLAE
ncbi:Gfo/Idh/MocA family oxidoreductase [Mycobacterium kansasii]